MKFIIEVGEAAKQKLEFSFNQLLGRTSIRLDGREVKKSVRLFSEPMYDTHIFKLADRDKCEVRIEKKRKHLFASQYVVYINNRLHRLFKGV